MAEEFNIPNESQSLPRIEKSPGEYQNNRNLIVQSEQTERLNKQLVDFKSSNFGDDDPTFLGFKIRFKLDSPNSPLFNGAASDYLVATGHSVNAEILDKLSNSINEVQVNRPWYFKSFDSIDNLEQMPNKDFSTFSDDFYYQISIDTWEDIEWRVQDIVEFYRRSVYDFSAWRWLLPENLRIFDFEIEIGEIRRFTNGEVDYNENQPLKIYRFKHCQFLWDQDLISSNLNVGTPEQFENNLSIGLGPYTVLYKSYDGTIFTDESLEKSENVDDENNSLERISQNNDEEYMDLSGKKKKDKLSYPSDQPGRLNDGPEFETNVYGSRYGTNQMQEGRRGFLRRVAGPAANFIANEIKRTASALNQRIEREISRVESAVRAEAQNALTFARRQADRRIQGLVPNISDPLDDLRARNNPLNPVITGNLSEKAGRLREIERELEKNLVDLNVYERTLISIRDGEILNIGNIYD